MKPEEYKWRHRIFGSPNFPNDYFINSCTYARDPKGSGFALAAVNYFPKVNKYIYQGNEDLKETYKIALLKFLAKNI